MLTPRFQRFLSLSPILVALAGGAAGPAVAATVPDRDAPAATVGAPSTKAMPRYAKLDGGLNAVATAADPLAAAAERGFRVRDGRLQVWMQSSGDDIPGLLKWLEAEGARWLSIAGETVQASVPASLLARLDERGDVRSVRRPLYLQKPVTGPRLGEPLTASSGPSPAPDVGSQTTEALGPMNVNAWHAAGLKGQSVKVGVVDLEFGGYASLSGSDLPAGGKLSYRAFGASQLDSTAKHGTACAEIVHDIAPELGGLYLAMVENSVDVQNAVSWLRSEGVKIVSQSAGYSGGTPGNGEGPDRAAIDTFTGGGGLWVNSAGNSGYSHWQGPWADANGDDNLDLTSDGGRFRNWITYSNAQTTRIPIPSGTTLTGNLTWNQWSSPTTDLDLYLFWSASTDGSSPEQVAKSDDTQNGGASQYPNEYISFTTTKSGYYSFQVVRFAGPTNVDVELFTGYPLEYRVRSGSITHPGDAPNVVSVAALDVDSPYALEPYSSSGPTNGSGGSLSGGSVRPDVSGFANVATVSYGAGASGRFNGTSSACPHAAGAAALLWGANPSWSSTQVRNALETNATDMGPGGKDNDYGYGRVTLPNPGTTPTSCTADATTLCLYGGRFKVQANWRDYSGNTGSAQAVPLTSDSGYFYFFSSTNVELVAKIVSFCNGSSGNYGLYASGLTDVNVTFLVTDTRSGIARSYVNPLGNRFCTIGDGYNVCP